MSEVGRWRYDGALKWTHTLGHGTAQVTEMGSWWRAEVWPRNGRVSLNKRCATQEVAMDWALETLRACETERTLLEQPTDLLELEQRLLSLPATVTGRLSTGRQPRPPVFQHIKLPRKP